MPTDYKCRHCMLRFSTGPYHYHNFDSGYCGRCLIVCTECGTQHALEAALRNRGPEYYDFYSLTVESCPPSARQKVVQTLRAVNNQLTLASALEVIRHPPFLLYPCIEEHLVKNLHAELSASGITFRADLVKREANPTFGPILCDLLHYFPGPQYSASSEKMLLSQDVLPLEKDGEFNYEILRCQHCNTVGSLTYEMPGKATRCPACKSDDLMIDQSWVT